MESAMTSLVTLCPLCGSNTADYRFTINKHDVLRCRTCSLMYIRPYPVHEEIVHEQVRNYTFEGLEVLDAEKQYAAEKHVFKMFGPRIESEVVGASSLLDVGCGAGHLLERLGARFPDMFRSGIELNNARAALARRHAGCEVHQVPIELFQHERRFDVILLINVLSHIPSFDSLFQAIRRLLAPNGKFVFQAGELTPDIRVGDIFDWGIPDHKHFLGMDAVAFLARKYGYRIVRHDRVKQSEELFRPETWAIAGRSGTRNLIKSVVRNVPAALPLLRVGYEAIKGVHIYSSFIVLTPTASR